MSILFFFYQHINMVSYLDTLTNKKYIIQILEMYILEYGNILGHRTNDQVLNVALRGFFPNVTGKSV